MNIYVASSWRNIYQQDVVLRLRSMGHSVYDFKNPTKGDNGFHWSEISLGWKKWTMSQYQKSLNHPIAKRGFAKDFEAMIWADCCVMVLPCGAAAHTEAGWMKGKGKHVFVYYPPQIKAEPELMYKVYDGVTNSLNHINNFLADKS